MKAQPQVRKKIAVIDSGSGGQTILRALKEEIAGADFFYLADFANFPYGTKSDTQVLSLATALARHAVELFKPDILVLACNTASTIALENIRKEIYIPVVGVVPAIKSAAHLTKTKVIGLLATPATIGRPYITQLIKNFASECRVICHGASSLVELAEKKVRGEKLNATALIEEIIPLFQPGLDTVVLGCTHFPLLLEEFEEFAPWTVKWVDSSEAIVRRVEFLLNN